MQILPSQKRYGAWTTALLFPPGDRFGNVTVGVTKSGTPSRCTLGQARRIQSSVILEIHSRWNREVNTVY